MSAVAAWAGPPGPGRPWRRPPSSSIPPSRPPPGRHAPGESRRWLRTPRTRPSRLRRCALGAPGEGWVRGPATCRTTRARPRGPDSTPRGERHGRPSGRRRKMPRSSGRLLHPDPTLTRFGPFRRVASTRRCSKACPTTRSRASTSCGPSAASTPACPAPPTWTRARASSCGRSTPAAARSSSTRQLPRSAPTPSTTRGSVRVRRNPFLSRSSPQGHAGDPSRPSRISGRRVRPRRGPARRRSGGTVGGTARGTRTPGVAAG